MNLRDRILATIAAAERRLALAEAADVGEPWDAELIRKVFRVPHPTTCAHIAANDPPTVAAEQRRIIAAGHADLALWESVESYTFKGHMGSAALRALNTRYPEVEA